MGSGRPNAERQPGENLDGRYRLVARLGRGGFGDVWRAEELLPGGQPLREVALKILRRRVAGQDWAAEARIIASLRHPALVTIYAAGELALEAPTPFVAMELLEGQSLERFVVRAQGRSRPVPWRRVVSWARQTAAALDTVHRAGVVHLDLKPANLFLAEGALKVLDFGIARQGLATARDAGIQDGPKAAGEDLSTAAFLAGRAEVTPDRSGASSGGRVFGTPGFMAPEVLEGGEATAAADAYALAALVVQLSTGRLPQAVGAAPGGTTSEAWIAEVQTATLRGDLRDLRADHPELPRALVQLMARWLRLDPAARDVAPGGLSAALEEVWNCPEGREGNPYRGLAPYRAEDEGRLFGRGPEVARLGRELADAPSLVLHGEPGVGLRSLILAGVVPALARGFADERHDWLALPLDLHEPADTHPDRRLALALRRFLARHGATPAPRPDEPRRDDPLDDPQTVVGELLAWVAEAEIGVVVVIPRLDRALEAPADRRAALTTLFEPAASHAPGIRLVATLPTAATQALLATEDLGPRAQPWLRFIGPLQAGTVDEIVEGAATRARRGLVEGQIITDDLTAELAEDGRRLGLISLALRAFWDQAGDGPLEGALWQQRGGVVGELCRHADRLVRGVPSDQAEALDALLLRLVSVSGEAVSRSLDDLTEGLGAEGQALIDRLESAQLVVVQGRGRRLSHPALVDRWPYLHDLRLRHLDRLGMVEEVREAARRWQIAGRARDLVWPPARLGEIARRGADLERELGEEERAFLDASRNAWRLSWLWRGLAVAFAAAMIVGMAWVDRTMDAREREQAERLRRERERAALGHMVTRARRSDDPYVETALLTAAMAEGSDDPALALELTEVAGALPRAEFLSLSSVSQADFPWGGRWLVTQRGNDVMALDFAPPAGPDFAPVTFRFEPHERGIYDLVPFAFDSAFVSRSLDGALAVWRLTEEGALALVAEAPMICLRGLSPVLVAERAPVVACTTERGLALWDLRRPDDVALDPFVGRGLHLSPDGDWLAATRLDEIVLWSPSRGRRHRWQVEEPPQVARFSPRDDALALIGQDRLEVIELRADPPVRRFEQPLLGPEPVSARWGASGVDIAICGVDGRGRWHYLRLGGRAPEDIPPVPSERPCRTSASPWPRPLGAAADYGAAMARLDLGPRIFEGGWQLEDGRLLTRDLVLFDPDDESLAHLLRPRADPAAPSRPGVSVTAVAPDGDQIAWGVGDQIRIHDRSGVELLRRPGRLLRRCPDGRLIGLRVVAAVGDEPGRWEIFGARHDALVAAVAREPGFVVGVDPRCRRFFVQGHEGHLGSVALDDGDARATEPLRLRWRPEPLEGYVYDVRDSPGWAGDHPPGLWLALSEGGIWRLEGALGELVSYGRAAPRATAMADGPEPGSLVLADDRGVELRRPGGASGAILEPMPHRVWSDLRVIGEDALLLAWARGVAVVDPRRHEILGELSYPASGRLTTWDDQGSVLAWSFAFMGQPRGLVLPQGEAVIAEVARAASNLRAELTASGPQIRRR